MKQIAIISGNLNFDDVTNNEQLIVDSFRLRYGFQIALNDFSLANTIKETKKPLVIYTKK